MSLTISLSVQPCAFKYFNNLASSSFDIKSPISFTCLILFVPPCGVSTFALNNQTAKRLFPFLRASRGLRGKTPYFVKPLELVNLWLVGFFSFHFRSPRNLYNFKTGRLSRGKFRPRNFREKSQKKFSAYPHDGQTEKFFKIFTDP